MVKESFWPHFPLNIPPSPGMHFGFQVAWWIFQIVVMGMTLIVLQRIGIMRDEIRRTESPSRDSSTSRE